jgi:hypothetical protein
MAKPFGKKGDAKNPRVLRGQSFSIEMFLVSTAVILIVLFFVSTFSSINEFKARSQRTHLIAEDAASSLVLSRGYPFDWDLNVSSAQALGLALRRNVLDPQKLNAVNATNYAELLGLPQYNVSINITSNSSQIFQTGYVNSSANVIQIERVCVCNNSPCRVKLQVSGGTQ